MNIQTTSNLNKYWALIKNAIMNAAFHTIDNHLTTTQQKKQQSTPQIDDALSHVKYLNKMLKLFTQANLQIQLPILQQRWTSINKHITDFAIRSYNYTIVLPSSIDLNSTDDIRTSIKQLSRIIQAKYDTLTHALNDKQICKFVRQRCDDYHDNQKHMIDSFLDRSKRTIIIDRVLQIQNDHQLLVTDPNEIKRLTNEHFQTCAGGVHTGPRLLLIEATVGVR